MPLGSCGMSVGVPGSVIWVGEPFREACASLDGSLLGIAACGPIL